LKVLMVEAGANPMARDVTVTDVLRYSKGVGKRFSAPSPLVFVLVFLKLFLVLFIQ
jgi:hypothetical protein